MTVHDDDHERFDQALQDALEEIEEHVTTFDTQIKCVETGEPENAAEIRRASELKMQISCSAHQLPTSRPARDQGGELLERLRIAANQRCQRALRVECNWMFQ